ncbi:hypothetical protein AB4865_05255 [Capnocytophaga sp. ARDL2]|uniref:hypothetical protein n=1 Tax=Capnocytophaga sp. ARDL2 TaxID=3238809 RepID=UPI003558E09A
MNIIKPLVFPDLIPFSDYGGDFVKYINVVYNIFCNDFIKSNPIYENRKVSVKKYPEVDGMHRTFYHITHQGEDENNRTPDIRRMERMKFPRFMIDNYTHNEILIWKNKRGSDTRTLLFNEEENYILVLSERKEYYLFVTAYYIEKEHRKRKLLKEYEAYKKTKTA